MFFRKFKNTARRYLAYLLAAAILITGMEIPAFAESDGPSYLNGWFVQCAWSSLSDTYEWNAREQENRQPKLTITYRLENADQEYPAGSLHFSIPGIGAAVRGEIKKANSIAADKTDSEWSCQWNQTRDLYEFTNKFTVAQGESVSGGFELLWNFEARDCEHGYAQKRNPVFQIDGIGYVLMHPLSYSFTSVRDRYRIDLYRESLELSDYEDADKAYVWYDMTTRFDKDWFSRGLYRSDYYVTIELPDGSDYGDVVVKKKGGTVSLQPDKEGNYGFYSFEHRSGDLGASDYSYYDEFTIGFRKEALLEQKVTVRSHLDRLYLDESDCIITAGENEIVDDELVFTVEDYDFTHEGYIYVHCKWNQAYENSYHQAPSDYSDRMNAVDLYNGKIVQFYLNGMASRNYQLSGAAAAAQQLQQAAYDVSSEASVPAAVIASPSDLSIGSVLIPDKESTARKISEQIKSSLSNKTLKKTARRLPDRESYSPVPEGIEDWNEICWWENELMNDAGDGMEWLEAPTYGEIHPANVASPSDAAWEDEEEEKGFWFDIPLINDLFSAGDKVFHKLFIRAYAAETVSEATPSQISQPVSESSESTVLESSTGKLPTKPGGNTTGISQIGENQEYSLVMGDDKLAVFLKDGSIRSLEDEEYDIAYVLIPQTAKSYGYEIYAADSQDTHFDEYHYYSSGKTDAEQTILLPAGVKAVFIRVNGITGSYSYGAYVGVRMHLNWREEQENGDSAPDHENRFVNFSYLRALYADEEYQEANDCAVTTEEYLGSYGKELAKRDLEVYQEQLMRDYSNVWLRSPITDLRSQTRLDLFDNTGSGGFVSRLTAGGTIQADNDGELKKFSVYTVIPEGLQYDFDNDEIRITGKGIDRNGNFVNDFSDHVSMEVREIDGKRVVAADFDYSDMPLEISCETVVSVSFPVTLSYVDYIMYGSQYTAVSYTMVHDDGHDKISGRAIMTDYMDLDQDGSTEEKIAYSNATAVIDDDANEWREYVSKYVSSAYSGGYTTDTTVRLYQEADTLEEKENSYYAYRLDFCLGASNAENITFYDRIEQGAVKKANGDTPEETVTISSDWQGCFVSADVSKAESLGMIPTVYYSVHDDQEFDLSAGGWSTELPENPADVRSIAVHLDTSSLESGMMTTKQQVYVLINMQAPSDPALVGMYAVNQYTVEYDAYSILGALEESYVLSSSETRVRLLDTVGRIVLQKADADQVTYTGQNGEQHFASLTGAFFQIYDSKKSPLFEEPKALNSLGRISLINVPYGTYYWEEVKAPEGYIREEGLHEFTIDGFTNTLVLKNHRVPGSVTLTKTDADASGSVSLSGASYALYNENEERVFTDTFYVYSADGTNGTFTTDENGSFTVTGLPWGSYYFVETAAPEGYELHESRILFRIHKNSFDSEQNRIHVEVTDADHQKTASLLLKKTDELSSRPLRNAVYHLYCVSEEEGEDDILVASGLKTNAAGEILVDDLKFGSYYFREIRNPGGYLMPDEIHAVTDVAVLGPDTTGETLIITHTNARKTGSIVLSKKDSAGLPVGSTEYELYQRDGEGQEFSLYGSYTTGGDSSDELFGIIEIHDMPWGEYYFKEIKAPQGYVLSETPIPFVINEETVQNTIYLEAVNELQKGSIRLKKLDKNNHETVLPGAVYELYRTDGTLCTAGIDYLLPEGITAIETGTDGTILISELSQGGYYLKEVKAPDSYSLNTELIRFAITKENAGVLQEIIAEDERGTAVLTIRKQVNEVYEPFGNPAFLFRIVRSDGREYYRSIVLTEHKLSDSASLTVDQGFTYTISEMTAARYQLEDILPGKNVVTADDAAIADLMTETEADVTFVNCLERFDKFSHTSSAENLVKSGLKLTAVRVEYVGQTPITKDSPGYDAENEQYRIQRSDLVVTAYFDDGMSVTVNGEDYDLTPEAADGSSDIYTGQVSYTYNGITKSDSFQVETVLPAPAPRYMVVFQLDGGTIIPDGNSSAQESLQYQVKSGTAVSQPVNAPSKDGCDFAGWYRDPLFKTEAEFPLTILDHTTLYAKWEDSGVKVKYAVSIYGVLQDEDKDGNLAGLTFGPATGDSYINKYKSHAPSAGQMCMHDMTWDDIIRQCAQDPSVFRECKENGCTHSVELKITGNLAQGAVSYPDMAGDGASTLFYSVNPEYRKWNEDIFTFGISWPNSRIYATLNGKEQCGTIDEEVMGDGLLSGDEALIGALPEELQNAIAAKHNYYHEGRADQKDQVSDDRLWLLRSTDILSDAIARKENGTPGDWWLRDVQYYRGNYLDVVREDGNLDFKGMNEMSEEYQYINECGISFGFCLPGPR